MITARRYLKTNEIFLYDEDNPSHVEVDPLIPPNKQYMYENTRHHIKMVCPHCFSSGYGTGFKKKHFDHCKSNVEPIVEPPKFVMCPRCPMTGTRGFIARHTLKCNG